MQKKHKVVLALAVGMAAIWCYLLWPEPSTMGELHVDPADKAAKLFDGLTSAPQWLSSFGGTEIINGIKVPPMPDPKINNATIGGVDTDHNGIRDDIDRMIAEEFGNSPKYDGVVLVEKALQNVMLNPTKQNAKRSDDEVACVAPIGVGDPSTQNTLHKLSQMERALVNTQERGNAYSIFAGTGIGRCPRK